MKPKSSRKRRCLIVAAVVFSLYLVTGFFIVPPIARSQLETRASEALKRAVTVEKVRVNPLVFSLAIHGLRVASTAEEGGELASWRELYVNFDPLTSLVKWEWHLGELRLVEPSAHLRIDAAGRLSIADLLEGGPAEPTAATPARTLPRAGIGTLNLERGAIAFTDLSRRSRFHTVAGPVSFELTGLTTRPNAESPYALTGTTDTGETFGWRGTLTARPLASKGRIEFGGLSIPKHAPFFEHLHNARVVSGRVSGVTDYEVSLAGALEARLANTSARVDELALAAIDSADPAVAIRRVELAMSKADAIARTAEIEHITVDGLRVRVERRPDGSIDLLDWIVAPPGGAVPAAEQVGSGPAPSVRVGEIKLLAGDVRLTDRTNQRPVELHLGSIEASARGAGTDLDREITLDLAMRLNETGSVKVDGVVRPLPMAAQLTIAAEGIPLAPFDPFIEPHADLRLRGGTVRVSGVVEASQPVDGALALTWTGDAAIASFAALDPLDRADVVGVGELALVGAKVVLDPLAVACEEVRITDPFAVVAIDATGGMNISRILRREAAAAKVATPSTRQTVSEVVAETTEQKLPFQLAIGAITIKGGRFALEDASVPGGFSTGLSEFAGSIRGLSSESIARADVDLRAMLDGVAPLQISGSINPLAQDKFSDITVDFSGIALPTFSPYSGRFIGKKIGSGTLKVGLNYRVSKNVLEGENHVVFDQFFLGDAVASPDALKLPIGLALALLRDREGIIELDVPVRGDLDDPDFKYGRVVWKAIGNIIVKAATSPFSMLGGMLGGGGKGGPADDLSFVGFASGAATLDEVATRKIGNLAKALFQRPALQLKVIAPPAAGLDRAGLIEQRFEALLAEEVTGAATPASGSDREARVSALYTRLFPPPPAPVVQPPPQAESEPPKRGFFSRIWRSLSSGEATGDAVASKSVPPPAPLPPLPSLDEMRAKIIGTITITDAEIAAVAQARANGIRDALLAGGQVEAARISIAPEPAIPEGAAQGQRGGRVFFGLE